MHAIVALAMALFATAVLAKLGWLPDVAHALSPRTWLNLEFAGFNVF